MVKHSTCYWRVQVVFGLELARIHAEERPVNLVLVARQKANFNALALRVKRKVSGVGLTLITEDLSEAWICKAYIRANWTVGTSKLIRWSTMAGFLVATVNSMKRELEAEQKMMQVNCLSLTSLTHYYLKGWLRATSAPHSSIYRNGRHLCLGRFKRVYYATKSLCHFLHSSYRGRVDRF